MKADIKQLLIEKLAVGHKISETNRLLESLELSMGGEVFEFAGGYKRFVSVIEELCCEGKLIPVKKSGVNGMTPVLYSRYRVLDNRDSAQTDLYINEILALHPIIKKEHYIKYLMDYEADREFVQSLNKYLQASAVKHWSQYRCTLNERSFEIFNDEKFLDKHGKTLFKKLGIDMEILNCYRTYEAFFYIFLNPGSMGNVLIIENKDTFMSLVNAIKDAKYFNRNNINLLIYGEGNKITKSFEFIKELYREKTLGTIFYYGDIDYPGIDICQRLINTFPDFDIRPHTALYGKLINSVDRPPKARNDSKTSIDGFLRYFDSKIADRLFTILDEGRYIPQEGFSFAKGYFEI